MKKKTERKILIEMFQFAKEMSLSEIPKIYELGHYLTDNLLSKICMVIGKEKGIDFTYTTKRGKTKTYDLNWLYNHILKKFYSNISDYTEIKDLHDKRNIYQHGYFSVEHHFHQQYAIDYVEKIEKILKEIGLISIFTGVMVRLFYDIFIKTEIDYDSLISNINIFMGIIFLVSILIQLIIFIIDYFYEIPEILKVQYKNISLNDCLGDLRLALILGSLSLEAPADPVKLLIWKTGNAVIDYHKFWKKDQDSRKEILLDKFIEEHNKLTKKYVDNISNDQE